MNAEHLLLREEVMAQFDAQLPESRRAVVSAHLQTCDECRQMVDEMRALSRELATGEVETAPAGLDRRARELVARRRAWAGWPAKLWIGAAASVAVAAVLVGPPLLRARPAAPSGPANLRADQFRGGGGRGQADTEAQGQQGQASVLVIRTASMSITTDKFQSVRETVESIVRAHDGRIGQIAISGQPPAPRSLHATLRVPPARLDAALTALRQLGRVTQESAASEDVTDSVRDLRVRIANSRREEQRLVELLARRTGDLKDVLEVERALARVRGEVEQMESQERASLGRVDFATVTLDISEAYRADLTPAAESLGTRLRNALIDGIRVAGGSVVSITLVLLQLVPTLAVWALLLVWPARTIFRRLSR